MTSSLGQRLKALQVKAEEPLEDISHLTLGHLACEVIDFGNKHKGKNYDQVWQDDQAWVAFMVARYSKSHVLSHRKFLRYVELQVSTHESKQEPIVMRPYNDSTSQVKIEAKQSSGSAEYPKQTGMALPVASHRLDADDDWESASMMYAMPTTSQPAHLEGESMQALQSRMLHMEDALTRVIQYMESNVIPNQQVKNE